MSLLIGISGTWVKRPLMAKPQRKSCVLFSLGMYNNMLCPPSLSYCLTSMYGIALIIQAASIYW